jgi:hypothetical protein
MAFGSVEKRVDEAIGNLLAIHGRQAEAITSQIKNLSARISLISRLVILLTNDVTSRARATEITKELRRLNTYRNNVVHGSWGAYHMPGDPSEEPYWSKLRVDGNNFKIKGFEVRLSELKKNRNDAVIVSVELTNFALEVIRDHMKRHEYAPWFEKPPQPPPTEDQSQD